MSGRGDKRQVEEIAAKKNQSLILCEE